MATLQFGKHRGEDISDVFKRDRNYAIWLWQQDSLMRRNPSLRAFLDERLTGTDLSYRLTFGKHKGRSVNWVASCDPEYLIWLRSNPTILSRCKRLAAALGLHPATTTI
jgi:hypothetical protein